MTGEPIDIVRANIERLMEARNIPSQKRLAELAGVDQKTVNAIFHPGGNPRLTTLDKIAVELGVAVWQLFMPTVPTDEALNRTLRAGVPADSYALAAALAVSPPEARQKILHFAGFTFSQLDNERPRLLMDKAAASAG